MSIWSPTIKCVIFIYARTTIFINLSAIHSLVLTLKLLYIIALFFFHFDPCLEKYHCKLAYKTANKTDCDSSLIAGTETVQDVII